MKYFAYGSNMLEERLQSPKRVPDATFEATCSVRGYRLRFHKRSKDQSGKCNIVKTDSARDVVYGVVFEVPDDQLETLDSTEGVGQGYHHDYNIPVQLADGTETPILAYVADSNAIDESLIPYEWYHNL
jgi:cation transport regulator ChaC